MRTILVIILSLLFCNDSVVYIQKPLYITAWTFHSNDKIEIVKIFIPVSRMYSLPCEMFHLHCEVLVMTQCGKISCLAFSANFRGGGLKRMVKDKNEDRANGNRNKHFLRLA